MTIMDKRLEKYYTDRFDMFGTQGWKDLMQDIEEMVKTTNTLNGVEDEKTLHFRKGELSIMQWLLNISAISEEAYRNLHETDE